MLIVGKEELESYIQQREQAAAQAEREKILKLANEMLNEATQMQGLRMWSTEVEGFLIKLKQRLEPDTTKWF